ncbi:PepSY domain-containing protein [Leucobacter chromiireducens]|uniref:PepSY domain-containing protein n=1 Tax=Leucobacter chromiireducens TaxID=283877 RepID=UPI0019D1F9CC|nr:PepSY domain-containing protein [Leucobacter chromiireducens]
MKPKLTRSSHSRRISAVAALAACALALTGCITVNVPPPGDGSGAGTGSGSDTGSGSGPGSSSPSGGAPTHDDFPATGIPSEVRWATDWLEGFESEGAGVRGSIVAIELEFEREQWIWEVTSRFPSEGPTNTTPERGFEADLAADSLAELRSREVTLDAEEREPTKIGIAEAARISGEVSPSPRLIALSLDRDRGSVVWEATLLDSETLVETELTIDATTGEILARDRD